MRPAVVITLLGSLLTSLANATAAEPPAGPSCKREPAKTAFTHAIDPYSHRQWKEAIPPLENAASLCPSPGGPWSIPSPTNPLVTMAYVPFFYLGNSYLGIQDFPTALRHFYLSTCVGESQRHGDKLGELSTKTQTSRAQVPTKDRMQSQPRFSDGFSAAQQQDWQRAADKMWEALLVWKEDGKSMNSYGRWRDPYLPRFRLADALFHLGCYREAAEQLDRSLAKDSPAAEVKAEREAFARLRPECDRKIREGYPDKEICQRWRCLLQQPGT